MRIAAAVAKTHKYAVRSSGDSAEVVERPMGGLSVLVVDGQGSGSGAKRLSIALAGRAAAMINDGARDGAVARTAHDWLFAQHQGRVSATLTILSAATDTETLVITRSGNCPAVVWTGEETLCFDQIGTPLGFNRYSRPLVDQVPLQPGMVAVSFSDGIFAAGSRRDGAADIQRWAQLISMYCRQGCQPEAVAEYVLQEAMAMDQGRPWDDMTAIVLSLLNEPGDEIRRLRVEYPLR